MDNNDYKKLLNCLSQVRKKTDYIPKVAIVLGSGLGDFAERAKAVCTVDYSEIEGFPVSTAPGHAGRFIFGEVAGVPALIMQGRIHYYEGYDINDVVRPVRLAGLLGVKAIILTNASGGIKKGMAPGDFMLITDQISCLVPSPLRGENIAEIGERFPDMSGIYDRKFNEIIRKSAKKSGIREGKEKADKKRKKKAPALHEGAYIQTSGPQFESPAEIRAFRRMGADAVGMSTAAEAIAAHHMGMRVCGISCITNLAAGIAKKPLSGDDVNEAAEKSAPYFEELVKRSVSAIGENI